MQTAERDNSSAATDLSLCCVDRNDQVSEDPILFLLGKAEDVCRHVLATPLLVETSHVVVTAQDDGELGLLVKVWVLLWIQRLPYIERTSDVESCRNATSRMHALDVYRAEQRHRIQPYRILQVIWGVVQKSTYARPAILHELPLEMTGGSLRGKGDIDTQLLVGAVLLGRV